VFESLSERLSETLRGLSGKGRLTDENISDALRDVRMALIEADVALDVVKAFTDRVRESAIGQSVSSALNPGEAFIKIVHAELVRVMGESNDALNLATKPPAIVLMAGLQGAGKTTTVAKLARLLKERERKKVAVVSADVYRPAAIKQLETLAAEVGAYFVASSAEETPLAIVERAVREAKTQFADVLLVDTAGRLAIDEEMMAEIRSLSDALHPIETLFVVDAMTGQDAAKTAKAFNEALNLTGVILAKADGDARGGAALSVRTVTGKPIKFIGMGESTAANGSWPSEVPDGALVAGAWAAADGDGLTGWVTGAALEAAGTAALVGLVEAAGWVDMQPAASRLTDARVSTENRGAFRCMGDITPGIWYNRTRDGESAAFYWCHLPCCAPLLWKCCELAEN